ncbi:MAG: hypothetical protein MUF34_26570, partial [Polyangiaceae bacterium]|nr:hypothetical protein [Polyangiaceae bacterium]
GVGAEAAHGGGVAGRWLGALHLRSAPATVVISLIVTFSWLASVVTSYALDAWGLGPGARWVLGSIVLVLAPLASLPATALVVRPLARLFVTAQATRGTRDFVGKVCTVRTGTVDTTFGEAVIAERGAEVIVRVRLDDDGELGRGALEQGASGRGALGRGDRALIVAFDEARDAFVVAPFDEVMEAPRRGGKPG